MSDIQALNNAHFNSKADQYDSPQAKEMTEGACAAVIQEFTSSTSPEHVERASVLEFGCGTGLCSFEIAPKVGYLLGLDVSEGMVNQLNQKLNNPENKLTREKVDVVLHQITHDAPLPEPEFSKYLAGPNGGFDMVFSNVVMHHIQDVQTAVDILANKMLKKDGWLIITDIEPPKDGQEGHGHHHHHHQHQHQHQHQCGQGHEHQHQHQCGQGSHGDAQKVQNAHQFFKDESGNAANFVAHKHGFSLEEFEQILKNAGLVDVEVKHSFGMDYSRGDRQVWIDLFVAKGRRA
ncbi:hypothetical protein BGX31_006068 [Mortierella sp. GBA43]|nr:hypothetical protein BGX31_006068 [Mortierella sp. GBA43]